ncbi:MAG: ROK family protein [Friedmanniella sp.]
MPDYVVAVDLGGTLTKVAYARRDGTITPAIRLPTVLVDGQVSVPWLAAVLEDAAASGGPEKCVGFGVVVPGIIDVPRGVVRAAPNVGWYDVPLRHRLSELTGRPGTVAHDVRSGGLAEWRLGAGVGASNLLFLPLGTGIAGAMIVDGRLVDVDGYAGEIGHITVPAAGELACGCGLQGCLETVASAAGVARTHARLAERAVLPAEQVAAMARDGDVSARAAFTLAVRALAEALTIYTTLLAPETVVIGGGLAGAFDLIGPPVAAGLEARMTFQRRPRLVPAKLGADAGVVGAGLVAWDRIREEES